VSGHGRGGYPGQGYDAPDYEGDPERTRQRRQGGGQQRNGSVWQGDQPGYDPQPGYGGQAYDDYGDPGYDPRGYGQRGGPGYPPPQGQGSGAYHYQDPGHYQDQGRYQDSARYQDPGQYQGTGPQPGQYGTGGRPQFDPHGTGPRGPVGGYDQRGDNDYGQGGYDDWEQDQSDNSFLPGFGGRTPERDPRFDYDDRRGRGRPDGRPEGPGRPEGRGRPDGRGPAAGSAGRGGRGPDPRGRDDDPRDRDDDPRDRYDDWDDRNRTPRKKATRWLPRILVLSVVGVIVIGGLVGGLDIYHKYQARYHPADYAGLGTGDVTVEVKSGDTAFSLAPRLLQLGVIASTRAFTNAAETATSTTSTNSTGLQAGFYQLHEHMQASLVYSALLNPKNRVQTTVTIPEGKRAVDVIAIISKKTKIPLKDFQQVLAHPAQLGLPSYANGKVEGYLFPATYAIVPHETALQILQAMVERFNVEAQQIGLVDAAKAAGLTPTNLIIEASLAQAEGGSVSDYPKIAEVINNRLKIGMHLQFDSTVLYGLGKYAVSATIKQTQTPGPYNTYLNAGLPAGPISNPGDSAIQGILHPDHGNWIYFLTVPNGKSQFSATPLQGQ
jgi:uncharacterized YceG family protein